jgi:hypothetical protein
VRGHAAGNAIMLEDGDAVTGPGCVKGRGEAHGTGPDDRHVASRRGRCIRLSGAHDGNTMSQ